MEHAQACKSLGIRPITGCEITLSDGSHLTLLCENAIGYRNLCLLLTRAHAETREWSDAGTARRGGGPPGAPRDGEGGSPGPLVPFGCARGGGGGGGGGGGQQAPGAAPGRGRPPALRPA